MTVRPIAPIAEQAAKPLRRAPVAPPPKLAWLALDQLVVDEAYQRGLSHRSLAMIRKIVATWSWSAFKPLSVARNADGLYEVIDGQHTAIAAATHGAIETLPCVVLTLEHASERASAFVEINTNRIALTAFAVHRAKVAAGDEIAVGIDQVLAETGFELAEAYSSKDMHPDNVLTGIGTLHKIVRNSGLPRLRRLLTIARDAEWQPLPIQVLKGLDLAVWKGTGARDAELIRCLSMTSPDVLLSRAESVKKKGDPLQVEIANQIRKFMPEDKAA